jgi:hypothetical protein
MPGIGYLSNGGTQRHLIEAESTTGFTAWKLTDGTVLICAAQEISIQPSPFITFWSCASQTDPTPAGEITLLDCHDNGLTVVDVRGLTTLKLLDCCHNRLTELDVSPLAGLEVLTVDHNQLTTLDVRNLKFLRVLNCSSNRIEQLDLAGLPNLQVSDTSKNPLKPSVTA